MLSFGIMCSFNNYPFTSVSSTGLWIDSAWKYHISPGNMSTVKPGQAYPRDVVNEFVIRKLNLLVVVCVGINNNNLSFESAGQLGYLGVKTHPCWIWAHNPRLNLWSANNISTENHPNPQLRRVKRTFIDSISESIIWKFNPIVVAASSIKFKSAFLVRA